MARAKAKSKPAAKSRRKPAGKSAVKSGPPLRERIGSAFAASRPWLTVAALVACVLGAAFGASGVRRAAANELLPRYNAAPVVFAWPLIDEQDPSRGTWLPEVYRLQLELLAGDVLDRDADPFSPTALRRLGEALRDSGWFHAAPSLRRCPDGSIEVTASWRRPAAVVRSRGRDHVVSWKAMPMPPSYAEGENSTLPVIMGVSAHPLGDNAARYTQVWPDESVTHALAVLLAMRTAGLEGDVRGIDVQGLRSPGGMLELVTSSGGRIEWGSPPGTFRPGEASDAEKIMRLSELRKQYGAIDASKARIKIWGPEPVIITRDAAVP